MNEPQFRSHVRKDRRPTEMPGDADGCWVVHTARTVHLFDLDHPAYSRLPEPGRKSMPYDRQWLTVREIVRQPRVGGQFLVYVDALDVAGAVVDELWRVCATIDRIEQVERADLDELLGTA